MRKNWPKVRLGDVLRPVAREEPVNASRQHRLLGVRSTGKDPSCARPSWERRRQPSTTSNECPRCLGDYEPVGSRIAIHPPEEASEVPTRPSRRTPRGFPTLSPHAHASLACAGRAVGSAGRPREPAVETAADRRIRDRDREIARSALHTVGPTETPMTCEDARPTPRRLHWS